MQQIYLLFNKIYDASPSNCRLNPPLPPRHLLPPPYPAIRLASSFGNPTSLSHLSPPTSPSYPVLPPSIDTLSHFPSPLLVSTLSVHTVSPYPSQLVTLPSFVTPSQLPISPSHPASPLASPHHTLPGFNKFIGIFFSSRFSLEFCNFTSKNSCIFRNSLDHN